MTDDSRQLDRTASDFLPEIKSASGSPPGYPSSWQPLYGGYVDELVIRAGKRPSTATIWFPASRWHEDIDIKWGDRIRIRTNFGNGPRDPSGVTVFSGFVTSTNLSFHGGDQNGRAYERLAVTLSDHRWLIDQVTAIYGQAIRTPDDYSNYGTSSQSPISSSWTFVSGQRCIFNAGGRANRDSTYADYTAYDGTTKTAPIFAPPSSNASPWTAKQMIHYIIAMTEYRVKEYLPIEDVDDMDIMSNGDFDIVLNHIQIEGLSVIQALDLICSRIGYSFREDYYTDGTAGLTFYKVNSANSYSRSYSAPAVLHTLYAPSAGETITTAVQAGKKMLWSAEIAEDIASVINNPYGLGSPHKFEITAELVPAWLDSALELDSSDSFANLYFYDWQFQEDSSRTENDYYKYYHIDGSELKRSVGRKWALNEAGTYSAGSYDRGMPFKFNDYIPAEYCLTQDGRTAWAPFQRQLLPALTFDADNLNSVGIIVDFSVDGGTTWYRLPAAIEALTGEAGIYIAEPNLADIYHPSWGTISGGSLDGIDTNFFTSLANDKINLNSYKLGQWQTRLRVTASIQMDHRLVLSSKPSRTSGSPFWHTKVYDFSDKYSFTQRTLSSQLSGTGLPAWNIDHKDDLYATLEDIRRSNEDMSISGRYTTDRIWLDNGTEIFKCGDSIEGITGRGRRLNSSWGAAQVYPEIIEVIYECQKGRQTLLTRDLRYTTIPLD